MKALFIALALLQQPPPALPADPKAFDGIDQRKVDEAIAAGVEFLKKTRTEKGELRSDGLILWTLIHAGGQEEEPLFKELLEGMLKRPVEGTYRTSLQALCLEKIDPERHFRRLYECAQYLADSQCDNGQWHYNGDVDPITVTLPTKPPPRPTAGSTKVKPGRKVPVLQRKRGSPRGDFSNSQYAALGIRACTDAGIEFPRKMIQDAREVWVEAQREEKKPAGSRAAVASGPPGAPPDGWCYGTNAGKDDYGSMTAGGVAAVIIYDHLLNIPWKKDPAVVSGIRWLGANFDVTTNPKRDNQDLLWHYYFIYSLERAGSLFMDEQMGNHYWYREGVRFLLDAQQGGTWAGESKAWGARIQDTCFAILFLRRATKPLMDVATPGAAARRP